MELASCSKRSVWIRAASHHSGHGLDDVEGTGCEAVGRVMKKTARSPEGEGWLVARSCSCRNLAQGTVLQRMNGRGQRMSVVLPSTRG